MGLFSWLSGASGTPEEPQTHETAPVDNTPKTAYVAFDIETTGLSPEHDRIIEFALLRIAEDGTIIKQWNSLLNPERAISTTHIHGLTQADVNKAPLFRSVAASIIPFIGDAPLVTHNSPFALAFLDAELRRAGWIGRTFASYSTFEGSKQFLSRLDRRRLADCCWASGVNIPKTHSALDDAKATAELLAAFMAHSKSMVKSGIRPKAALTETPAAENQERTTVGAPQVPSLQHALSQVTLDGLLDHGAPESTLAYLELVLMLMEDSQLTDQDADAFADLVTIYGMSADDARAAHAALVVTLAQCARADGIVTSKQRIEVFELASALGVDRAQASAALSAPPVSPKRSHELPVKTEPLPQDWAFGEPLRVGDRVAFASTDDEVRTKLEDRAAERGVRVMSDLSARTSLLVADSAFQGRKFLKAQQIGTRIVPPTVFEVLLSHIQPAQEEVSHIGPHRPHDTATPQQVRTWALQNGHQVGTRGRIPDDSWVAYVRATASPALGSRS